MNEDFFVTHAAAIYGDSTFEIETAGSKIAMQLSTVTDSADRFDEDTDVSPIALPGKYKHMSYIPWGCDNNTPYTLIELIGKDEVMAQNKHFNALTCYGTGLVYRDLATKQPTTDHDIRRFMLRNSYARLMLEQATDMKYFFFAVAVVILSNDGKRIVKVRHKDASNIRFEKADKKGKIKHVFYGNWRKLRTDADVEVITLLDDTDPWGELEVLMGREPGTDGVKRVRTTERKFAVLSKFPTAGCRYYPHPYYTALFRGDWYDIKQLIPKGKKAKIKNHAPVKYQVEVNREYWKNICKDEGINDPLKQAERIKQEKQNIQNFVSGIENSGKAWITGYYCSPDGKEIRMVRINVIDTGKEGGDWSEDIQEASNMVCYADSIHPNMVGAVPGKAQSNNSGSDKRELFTLKQSLETGYKHILFAVHTVIIGYNGWFDMVEPDIPMILLTTLDKNTDAVVKSSKEQSV